MQRRSKSTADRLGDATKVLLTEVLLWKIMTEVAEKYEIDAADIMGERRFLIVCRARQEFFYRALEETTISLVKIGLACGGRDHSSVPYNAAKWASLNGLKAPRGTSWTGKRAVVYAAE